MKDEKRGSPVEPPCFHFRLHPSSLILHPFDLEAMKGVEPLSFGLQDRRSVIQLSYIATGGISGLGGSQTLTRSLQDFYAVGYITSPKLIWWLWVESNQQPRAYETLALSV